MKYPPRSFGLYIGLATVLGVGLIVLLVMGPRWLASVPDAETATVATAPGPSRPTQNTSRMPNSDSIAISRTMGIASRNTARPSEPSV